MNPYYHIRAQRKHTASNVLIGLGLGMTIVSAGLLISNRLGDDLDPASPTVTAPPTTSPELLSTEAVIFNECASEDEVIVQLKEPAYDKVAGETFCVHVDYLRPTK